MIVDWLIHLKVDYRLSSIIRAEERNPLSCIGMTHEIDCLKNRSKCMLKLLNKSFWDEVGVRTGRALGLLSPALCCEKEKKLNCLSIFAERFSIRHRALKQRLAFGLKCGFQFNSFHFPTHTHSSFVWCLWTLADSIGTMCANSDCWGIHFPSMAVPRHRHNYCRALSDDLSF